MDNPTITFFYDKTTVPILVLTFPESYLKILEHHPHRPYKATLWEPDGWVRTSAYNRWLQKCREQAQ